MPPDEERERVGPEPETFGASPDDIARVKSILTYVESGGRSVASGLSDWLARNSAAARESLQMSEDEWAALEEPDKQRFARDVYGLERALGHEPPMPEAIPPALALTGSIFLGPRDAELLAQRGRPAAKEALDLATRLDAQGIHPAIIRNRAHEIFRQYGEPFGNIYKPDYEGAEWLFEVATNKGRTVRRDPSRESQPLSDRYVDPVLYNAAPPGLASVNVPSRSQAGPSYHQPSMEPGVQDEIGLQTRAGSSARDQALREIQNYMNWANDLPRGGRIEEFRPGGALESRKSPGETDISAYNRLEGTRLAKAAAARGQMTPEQLRNTPVHHTLRELGAERSPSIIERYEGEPIRTHAEDEKLGGRSEKLAREDQLGKLAENVAKGARQTVADMKAAGASPEDIAARMTKEYGSPVTAEQVQNNQGWWSVPAAAIKPRWTPEQHQLFFKLYHEGVSYPEIANQLRALGRNVNPNTLSRLALYRGYGERARGGDRRTVAARIEQAGLHVVKSAKPGIHGETFYGLFDTNGELVGRLKVHADNSVGNIWVEEAYQRQGLAKALYEFAAKDRGVEKLKAGSAQTPAGAALRKSYDKDEP